MILKVKKMYEDMLKEKENLGIKLVHGEEEKKKLTKENELLAKKIAENGRVCMIMSLSYSVYSIIYAEKARCV